MTTAKARAALRAAWSEELFEVFIGEWRGTGGQDYARTSMNPATKEEWKRGLLAVAAHAISKVICRQCQCCTLASAGVVTGPLPPHTCERGGT